MKALKKWIAGSLIAVMGFSLAGCGKAEEIVPEPVPVAEVTEEELEEVLEEVIDEAEEEDDVDDEEEYVFETEYIEEEEEEEEPENQISYQDVMDSYDELVGLFNSVNETYQDDSVPRDESVENLMSEIWTAMDEIAALREEDIPTDEDRMEVLKRIGELDDELGQMIESIFEAAEEENAYYNQLADIVQSNYDYMDRYYNAVWDHLSKYGGTDSQVEAVILARDEIGELQDLSTATSEDLKELNERINYVTSLLDAICASP